MHPTLPTPGAAAPCAYRATGGTLEAAPKDRLKEGDSAIYVSGINPYGIYRADVRSISPGAEIALEFATVDRNTRVAVVAVPGSTNFLTLRLFKDGQPAREQVLFAGPAPEAPYSLCVEFSGVFLSVYTIKDGQTTYLGRVDPKQDFGDVADFRSRATAATATFNIATRVPAGGKIVLDGARAFLGSGIGQADIRAITHSNGAPYIEDNRLWFTFSSRGLGTGDACQGVMSIDPSVFDPRFEGVIVFDRGDGLLRNDYASNLFYDDQSKEWRALTCCFSASKNGRGGASGIAMARSSRDPRRGFSVMSEALLTKEQLPMKHEDPSLIYDAQAKKWRLATSCFEKEGLRVNLFESDRWDGPFTKIAGPVEYDSTGTLIQKIGSKWYVFSGTGKGPSGKGAVLIYSYPDLRYLGEMKVDLPATMKGGRIWAGVLPLPVGYPARYMALTMDRMNFPEVKGGNWSYGALYLFWADTADINGPYEFDPTPESAPEHQPSKM